MKVLVRNDTDKQDLIDQQQVALARLDEIINNPLNTTALVVQASKDEGKIIKKILILLKKILLHEI